jgi:Cytochrome c7 and related cytochrome c/Class III cytochrome C family
MPGSSGAQSDPPEQSPDDDRYFTAGYHHIVLRNGYGFCSKPATNPQFAVSQIFSRRFGTLAKFTLLGALAGLVGIVGLWRMETGEPHDQDEAVEQPVPFSHKHHVGDVGLDCRYCHASVEKSASASIPPISTCMTCHSQLFTDQAVLRPVVQSWQSGIPLHWERVYALPQFVYFDHSIHIAKGVGCVTCHGQVDQMPLTARKVSLSMQWCLDCHRAPAKNLRPPEAIFSMTWQPAEDPEILGRRLLAEYKIDTQRLTDCSVCHR